MDKGTTDLALPAAAGVELSKTGATVTDPSLPWEHWAALLDQAVGVGDSARWIVGDLLVFGLARYGEDNAQALGPADTVGQLLDRFSVRELSYRQAERYRYVAYSVDPSRRRGNLSFSHHELVAAQEAAQQAHWLARAEAEALTVAALKEAIRDSQAIALGEPRRKPRPEVLPAPTDVVDAARKVSDVRRGLARIGQALSPEAAEEAGIGRMMRDVEDVGKTLRKTVAATLERPDLGAAVDLVAEKAQKQTRLPDPAYLVPAGPFEAMLEARDTDKQSNGGRI